MICNHHLMMHSDEISTVDARIIWSKYLSCSGNFKVSLQGSLSLTQGKVTSKNSKPSMQS